MMRRCFAAPLLTRLYAVPRLRRVCFGLLHRLEGGEMFSATQRAILERYHGVTVGDYSYGECMKPGSLPPGVTVGRYVSIGQGLKVFGRNHPLERLSMHPFFYNSQLGTVAEDTIGGLAPVWIGHDAWIGANAILTPRCRRIGIGAVVGAGAVVTMDVPDFAVVVGNPAKIVKYRFSEEMQATILDSRWWERPLEECLAVLPHMIVPLSNAAEHPLLAEAARATSARG